MKRKTDGIPGFADRIRALCEERGTTLKEVERKLGIANGYIANTQKRKSQPSSERVTMLAEYFGVTREYLLGIAYAPGGLSRAFTYLLHKCGMDHCRLHDLRHSFVSIAHAQHMPDAYIQERGGWSTDFVMKNVYRHTFDDVRTAEQQKINQAFISLIPEDKKSPPDAHTDNRG